MRNRNDAARKSLIGKLYRNRVLRTCAPTDSKLATNFFAVHLLQRVGEFFMRVGQLEQPKAARFWLRYDERVVLFWRAKRGAKLASGANASSVPNRADEMQRQLVDARANDDELKRGARTNPT